MGLGGEGRTPISHGNWSPRLVPKEEFRWKKECRNALSALGTPVTGCKIPDYKIPLNWVNLDSADRKSGGHCGRSGRR